MAAVKNLYDSQIRDSQVDFDGNGTREGKEAQPHKKMRGLWMWLHLIGRSPDTTAVGHGFLNRRHDERARAAPNANAWQI